MTTLSEKEIKAALYAIENINENGYLEVDYDEVSRYSGLDPDSAETVIQTIQTFDPLVWEPDHLRNVS